jgi:hypothetical protein
LPPVNTRGFLFCYTLAAGLQHRAHKNCDVG